MATDIQCTFEGIPFRIAPQDVLEKLERYDYARLNEVISPYCQKWRSVNLSRLGVPEYRFQDVKIGQFFYPTNGASRWACFRGLMTSEDVDAVREIVWTSSSSTHVTGTFKMYQPVSGDTSTQEPALETELYMLPPVPVLGVSEDEPLYIVTLVDERYFWQWKDPGSCLDISSFPATNTWVNLVSWLTTGLGISPSGTGSVSETPYYETDSPFYSHFENAAQLLDAALLQRGQSIQRAMDGTYAIDFWSSIGNNYYRTYISGDSSKDGNRIVGGRCVYPSGDGVLTAKDEYRPMVPRYVVVTFPKWNSSPGEYRSTYRTYRERYKYDSYPEVYSVTVSASDILGAGYYFSGTCVLRTSAKAKYTNSADSSVNNQTEMDDLAEYLATAYLNQKIAYIDETYPGICANVGAEWSDMLITWNGRDCCTRFSSPPFNMENVCEFFHSFDSPPLTHAVSSVSSGGTGVSSLTVGQVVVGNGTSAVDQLTSTRTSGETLECKLTTDRWVGFSSGSY